jgi:hypothetical protein
MWSHYSDSHRGFCIRYNLDVLAEEIELSTHDSVTYTNEIQHIIGSIDDGDFFRLANSLVMQKAEDWKYEEEYRLILNKFSVSKDDKTKCVFHSADAIDRIYFGSE